MKNSRALNYFVTYLVGGSSNFVPKACNTQYASKDDAKKELADMHRMGYVAMIADKRIGGFESFDSPAFHTREEATTYYSDVKLKFTEA